MIASAFALLSLAFPPVSIVSSAAVALVTLRHGSKEGLWILACASLAAAVLSAVVMGNYQFALLYGVILWTPVWLVASVLRTSRNLATAIETAVLLALAVILAFYLYQPDPALFWRQILEQMLQAMQGANPDVSSETMTQSADVFAHYMTGGVAAGSLFGLLFGLFLGRGWQASLYNPGGFKQEYLSLKAHKSLALASLLLCVLGGLASGLIAEICWNLVMVLFVLYTVLGASVLHTAFAGMNSARFMVPFLYATLLIIPHVMVLVAILGVLDTGLDLRSKFKSNGA